MAGIGYGGGHPRQTKYQDQSFIESGHCCFKHFDARHFGPAPFSRWPRSHFGRVGLYDYVWPTLKWVMREKLQRNLSGALQLTSDKPNAACKPTQSAIGRPVPLSTYSTPG